VSVQGSAVDLARDVTLSALLVLALVAAVSAQTPPVNPDARAYAAFASGNQAELARWRSQGGDAARYAKENPDAIHDAMGSERDVSVLEFVLASGADPNARRSANAKTTPILVNSTDRDKVVLLLRYGAQVNVRDDSRYAPLSYVLSAPTSVFTFPRYPRGEQKVRRFAKADVVRLLLDSGAEINGNLGGWGAEGALGLARREDKDVIDLLVARGATFNDDRQRTMMPGSRPLDRGPITIAVEQARDDLALALLRRDQRVGAKDEIVVLEAARRGYSEVALVALAAGADPNAMDAKGATPLGWALRRKDTALVAALRAAGAAGPERAYQPALPLPNLGAFEQKVAREIDAVAWFDPDRFYPAARAGTSEVAFAFYGNSLGALEAIRCESSAGFSIIAQHNTQGQIQAGICKAESARVRDATQWARGMLAQMMSAVAATAAGRDSMESLGWEWKTASHADGWEGYSFPVIAAGHGIAVIPTVVLLGKAGDRAVIVQADLGQLCERTHRTGARMINTPLCDDTTKALTEIALAIARMP
jgi:ankyrin repeat protein